MDLTLRKVLAMLKGHGSGQAHDEIAAEKVPTTDAFDESDEDHGNTPRKVGEIPKFLHRGVLRR